MCLLFYGFINTTPSKKKKKKTIYIVLQLIYRYSVKSMVISRRKRKKFTINMIEMPNNN